MCSIDLRVEVAALGERERKDRRGRLRIQILATDAIGALPRTEAAQLRRAAIG